MDDVTHKLTRTTKEELGRARKWIQPGALIYQLLFLKSHNISRVGKCPVFNSYMNSKETSENDEGLFHYHSNKLLKQCPFLPNSINIRFTSNDAIFFSFKSETAFVSAVYQVAHLQPSFLSNFLCVCAVDSKHFPKLRYFLTAEQLKQIVASCENQIQLQ